MADFLAKADALARDSPVWRNGDPKVIHLSTGRFGSTGFGGVFPLLESGGGVFLGGLRGGRFGGGAVLPELESREHPEVMREDRPADDAFAGGEGFAPAGAAGKMVFENRDACFGAAAALEAGAKGGVSLQTFLQLGGVAGAEAAFNFPLRFTRMVFFPFSIETPACLNLSMTAF